MEIQDLDVHGVKWTAIELGGILELPWECGLTGSQRQLAETKRALRFLKPFGLFKDPDDMCSRCSQGWMKLYADNSHKDGIIVKCSTRRCNNKRSAFKGTWFEGVHMPLRKIVYFLYFLAKRMTPTEMIDELECSATTAADMSNFCRELCEAALLEEGNDFKIGGPGCTVEIDESLFRKRKYHRGKKKSGEMWVFGGFCRETGVCFLEYVPDRSANTLIPIIKRRISNGTRIISDCWKAYARLKNDIDYTYFLVNHSIEFVSKNDPSVHTNSIEGCWRLVKRNLPVTGTTVEMQESYLSEFMWRKKRRNENSFVALLYDIANVYRLDHIEIEQVR